MKMKTWKYRLMPGIKQRSIGASKLLRAHGYLTVCYRIDDYSEKMELTDEAPQLLWHIWRKDGNFYRKGQAFPKWQAFIERKGWSIRLYFHQLLGALLNRDLHSGCE